MWVTKRRRMRWKEHVAQPEGKRPLGHTWRRYEYNIKMCLQEADGNLVNIYASTCHRNTLACCCHLQSGSKISKSTGLEYIWISFWITQRAEPVTCLTSTWGERNLCFSAAWLKGSTGNRTTAVILRTRFVTSLNERSFKPSVKQRKWHLSQYRASTVPAVSAAAVLICINTVKFGG